MLIMSSPTKQMKLSDRRVPKTLVSFPEETQEIVRQLQTLSEDEIKVLMKVNDKLAKENKERYPMIRIDMQGSCAIDTYQGLQFKYMHIQTKEELTYVQEHLRILSAVYGIVRPLDSIYPYRLEMQTPLAIGQYKNMYAFWSNKLANNLIEEVAHHKVPYLLNLASQEYSKAVLAHIDETRVITLVFQIRKQGKLKIESTQAKMARGRMIHYLAKKQIETLAGVQAFCEDGYQFQEALSDANHYVFVKEVIT